MPSLFILMLLNNFPEKERLPEDWIKGMTVQLGPGVHKPRRTPILFPLKGTIMKLPLLANHSIKVIFVVGEHMNNGELVSNKDTVF